MARIRNSRQEVRFKFLCFIEETCMRDDNNKEVLNVDNFATISVDQKEQAIKELMTAQLVIFRRKWGDLGTILNNDLGSRLGVTV